MLHIVIEFNISRTFQVLPSIAWVNQTAHDIKPVVPLEIFSQPFTSFSILLFIYNNINKVKLMILGGGVERFARELSILINYNQFNLISNNSSLSCAFDVSLSLSKTFLFKPDEALQYIFTYPRYLKIIRSKTLYHKYLLDSYKIIEPNQ